MASSRIATVAVDGSVKYGAVTDRGIVDLSARRDRQDRLMPASDWTKQ
jgi:hypothetical protein